MARNPDGSYSTEHCAPILTVERLRKRFGVLEALAGIDLTILQGEVVVVIGPSGSGKSTLLRCMNALETIQGGEIVICGHDVSGGKSNRAALRSDVGMVFQSYNLFPHLTAERNITLALTLVKKHSKHEALRIAAEVLALVGLADKSAAYPEQLSGGQQQRVAIARSLALSPKVMLFDEVTSALDPELVGEVLDVMKQLATEGTTMIVVTHEMAFARDVADRVVVMDAGQVVEQGVAEEVLLQPKNPRTASFLSRFHSTIGERKN